MNPEFYFGAVIVFGVVLLNGIIKNKTTIKQEFKERVNSKK